MKISLEFKSYLNTDNVTNSFLIQRINQTKLLHFDLKFPVVHWPCSLHGNPSLQSPTEFFCTHLKPCKQKNTDVKPGQSVLDVTATTNLRFMW